MIVHNLLHYRFDTTTTTEVLIENTELHFKICDYKILNIDTKLYKICILAVTYFLMIMPFYFHHKSPSEDTVMWYHINISQ